MIFVGKDYWGDIFFSVSDKYSEINYSDNAVLELYDSYFEPDKQNNNPYCAVIKNDQKLIIEDFKLCEDIFNKLIYSVDVSL